MDYIEGLPVEDIIEGIDGIGAETWIPILNEKNFTPSHDDVGCAMRIECRVTNALGELLTAPVVIHTEPVLASPTPAKLELTAIPGITSTNNRLRIVSYNILAEIYATRQVCTVYCIYYIIVYI